MLGKRVIFGSLLAAVIILLMLADAWLAARRAPEWLVGGVNLAAWLCNGLISTLIVLVLSLLAAREVSRFIRASGFEPSAAVVQPFAAGLVFGPYISFNLEGSAWHEESWGLPWVALALGLALLLQAIRRGTERATLNVAATLFVIVYTGGLAGFLTRLRMEVGGGGGAALLLFSMFLVKMNDVGAYFTGRLLGRHQLIPWLSPKKTWEGLGGGVAVTIVCALAVGCYLHGSGLTTLADGPLAYPWGLIWFGLLMAMFSVAGDLAASLLKRDAAMKDSGQAIPGLGGVLDVLDSPLLAAPVAWFFWTRVAQLAP